MARSEASQIDRSARRPRRPGLRSIALLIMLAALAYAVLQAFHMLPSVLDPFAQRTKDRSGPVVLRSIRNLSRYEAATGEFQVIVDLEKDAQFLPRSVRGERTLFVGNGTVDAYVDFSHIADRDLTVSQDRESVTIRLPHARLERTNLDANKSYVLSRQRGLLNRIGDVFGGNPNSQQQLYALAAQKITDAANGSGLAQRADTNTQQMMTNLLRGLGFKQVTVTFATAP